MKGTHNGGGGNVTSEREKLGLVIGVKHLEARTDGKFYFCCKNIFVYNLRLPKNISLHMH
jgi:hypothetical protein